MAAEHPRIAETVPRQSLTEISDNSNLSLTLRIKTTQDDNIKAANANEHLGSDDTAHAILKWIGDAKCQHTGPGQSTVVVAGRGGFSEISDD
jgi:hypothetical protein